MALAVKVCGLRRPVELRTAAAGGASCAGLVFFPPSPRSLALDEAGVLAQSRPSGLDLVGVFVDPDDAWLDAVLARVPLDIVQMHGGEDPARVAEVRARTGKRVMKALAVAGADDLAKVDAYAEVADLLLFDAKAPKGARLPGGNGLSFDWRLLSERRFERPWFLAGGLDEDNLDDAVRLSGARAVDVSSGVEAAPGRKDLARLRAFLAHAARLESPSKGSTHG